MIQMESIWHVSECTPLAGLTLLMSLAYSRLKGTRQHYAEIVAASRQELSRLGDREGALDKYKGREYYLILKALAEEHTVSRYKAHVRSSGSLLSGLFIDLSFRGNLDRKISNWITGFSLIGMVAGNPPLAYWLPQAIMANAIIVGVYSTLLVSYIRNTCRIIAGLVDSLIWARSASLSQSTASVRRRGMADFMGFGR